MRKFLCIILILIMCSLAMFSYATNTTDLQTQAEELQDQIDSATSKLDLVDEELSENLQELQKLDATISENETSLQELNSQIYELQALIDEVEEELSKVEENYNSQKSLLDERMVSMYETGEVQYIDVILNSSSISEFISNYFLISELASYDIELLEEVESEKNKVEERKAELEESKTELRTIQQSQTQVARVLENTKIVREYYISKLTQEEQEIQAQIDEYNAQYNAIESEILQLALNSISEEYLGGIMAWPVPGYTTITSRFGMRTHPITGVYKLHSGVDISAPRGASFVAAADGVVIKAEYNSAYGNMVIIDHGGGINTLYAHGDEIVVQLGQTVSQNDVVLKVGSTGYSTGPHAHFEVRVNGVAVEPLDYITSTTNVTDNSNEDTGNEITNY